MGLSVLPGLATDAVSFARELVRHEIDVVQVGPLTSVQPEVIEAIPCAVVATSWGFDVLIEPDESAAVKEHVRRVLRRADALIADCQTVVDRVYELEPGFAAPVFRFPLGVELSRFRTLPEQQALALRERLGWTENTVLISTRTWNHIYGVDNLIEAFARAVKLDPSLRLLLLGDGPLRGEIQTRIDALGLRPFIEAPGGMAETELPVWFCAADLYVSSAKCDGTSISLLEAMACGKPVVANNRFGNLEWVEPGVNGWLGDCSNADGVFAVIQKALAESAAWIEIGKANRALAFAKADWECNQGRMSEAFTAAVMQATVPSVDAAGEARSAIGGARGVQYGTQTSF